MKIAYGHEIEADDDEYIKMTENVSLAHVDAGDPGTALVDFFPIRESLCLCAVIVFLITSLSSTPAVVVPGLLVQPCRSQLVCWHIYEGRD